MTQKDKIRKYLNDNGSITPAEAYEEFGIMRLAARIKELKDEGDKITSTLVGSKNRYGETVFHAKYTRVV